MQDTQLEQKKHQDPQEVGGAHRGDQLREDGQTSVVGHMRERVGEHVHDPGHHDQDVS